MCHLLWWIGQGGNFYSLFGPKNTNLVEDVKPLLLVKFRWIQFRGFRGKVKICLSQSEARAAILFLDKPEKTQNLVEDVENLLSVKFCWIRFSGFIGEVKKCLSQSEGQGGYLVFLIGLKKPKPGRGMLRSYFLSSFVEFYSAVSEQELKMSQQIIGQGGHFVFSDPPEKHKLGWGRWDLASYQVSSNSFHSFRGEVENVSVNQRLGRQYCFFPICLKSTNVVEGIESLLPVKFCWIPFRGFYREVENVSANQRPGWPFCFSDRPKKHKLGRKRWDLPLIKFHWIQFSGFRGEVENVSANQRPGRPSCFSDWPEKHKLGRGRWELASCQDLLNSI